MSIVTDFDEWRKQKELAIYGAVLAQLVIAHQRDGRGSPDEAQFKRYREEAWAIAKWDRELDDQVQP